jgi:hypothetical protein
MFTVVPRLTNSLRDWPSPAFVATLRAELEALGPGILPLHLGVTEGGMVDDSNLQVTVIRSSDDDEAVHVLIGAFFTEIVGGCSCGDEPQPKPAYCEMQLHIDRRTAEVVFQVQAG